MRKILAVVLVLLFVAACFARSESGEKTSAGPLSPKLPQVAAGDVKVDEPAEVEAGPKTYGSAELKKVAAVEDGFAFRCDVKGWPAIIAEDITVRVNAVECPEVVAGDKNPNKFFEQHLKKFLESSLIFEGEPEEGESVKPVKITLENIQRGEKFSLIADVFVDGISLAEILIENGFARKYSKEDAKAEVESAVEGAKKVEPVVSAPINMSRRPVGVKKDVAKPVTGYVASKTSKVFHRPDCRFAKSFKATSKKVFSTRQQATQSGRRPCKTCSP